MSGDALLPDEDALPEPYWAIMETGDENHPTANMFAHGNRVLLFADRTVADGLLDALTQTDPAHSYAIRGITKEHLRTLAGLADGTRLELWEIVSLSGGEVKGHPIRALDQPVGTGQYFKIEE